MARILLFLMGIISLVSYAQDGSMDTSFGDGGIVETDLDNSKDLGWSVVQQADQKLVVSGATRSNSNQYNPYLIRYTSDGSVDTSFGTDGKVITDHGDGYNGYEYLFIDNQQNIVAAGNMNQGSNYIFIIAKYLENGDLDTNFGVSGVLTVPNGNSDMTILNDGSILLLRFSGNDEITINHYLSNGVLDTNFGTNGAAISNFVGGSFTGRELKVDEGNNIYFVGIRANVMDADIILMKFQPNGYLDNIFGDNGIATKNIDATIPIDLSSAGFDFTNDGKIVVAGSIGACLNEYSSFRQPFFLKYNSNGSPDTNFGDNGTRLLPISDIEISQVLIQANQRMVITGETQNCFEGSSYTIGRYYSNGTLDNSFWDGTSIDFEYYKSIFQEDGKIVSVGNTIWYDGLEDIVLLRHNNTTLSLPEFKTHKAIIYPNPSNGIFTIERDFYSEMEAYQITDITGKIIANGQLGDKQTQINLSSASGGVYFLKTSNDVFRLLKN